MADEGEEDSSSLYAILNVRRDATEAEIKKAYRQLAQLYHPDKHTDPALKARAEASFTRLHLAYEVLCDEAKRSVYDVYGQQGLEAGLSVVPHASGDSEALRRNWAKFQEQQAEARMQAEVSHRGHYIARVDATDMINPYDRRVASAPEIVSIVMQDNVHLPVSANSSATIGCCIEGAFDAGQAGVRKGLGFGAFICGLRRELSPDTAVEAHTVLGGLKALITLSSTQRFGENANANIAATYSHRQGVGMQVGTSRRLSQRWHGETAAVMGAGTIAGMTLALTFRADRFIASAKLEAGLGAGISARCIWHVREGTTARVAARASLTGMQLEVGALQKVGDFSTAGCSVVVNLQGVIVKPQFARGSHLFEVPVLLSHTYQDPLALAVAYLLPPAASLCLHHLVLRPLRRHWKVQEALQRRQAAAKGVWAALKAAEGDNALMAPVAQRQLQREAARGGLVILVARYGDLDAILRDEEQQAERQRSGQEASSSSAQDSHGSYWQTAHGDDMELEEDPEVRAAVEEALAAEHPPPPWADVTTALRYLLRDGRVSFHSGVSKRGLMGFCDAAPGIDKALRVQYFFRNRPHIATYLDLEGGELPSKGALVSTEATFATMLASASQQGIPIQHHQDIENHDSPEHLDG